MGGVVQTLLLTVGALACPIGMGVMMLMMGRGTRSDADTGAEAEVAQLRAEVEQLRSERAPRG
jgi:hypothetical protein